MLEDKSYKLADYLVRSGDRYALTKYEIVMKWLPQKDNLRILNVGCGSGEMNILLAQKPSWRVDAIDIDADAVEISHKLKAEHQIENLNIYHSSIEDFTGLHGRYDVIVSNDVLEHIENDLAAIKHLSNLVKPNGIVCISVPALQWLFGYHDEQLGHYRRYSRINLTHKLSKFLDVKKCRYFAAILIPIALLYSCWLRKSYPVGGLGKESLIAKILKWLLAIEAKIPLPIGTSLIALATPRGNKP